MATFIILFFVFRNTGPGRKVPQLEEAVIIEDNSTLLVSWKDPSLIDRLHEDDRVNIYVTQDPCYDINNGIVTPSDVKLVGIHPVRGDGKRGDMQAEIKGLGPNTIFFVIVTVTCEGTNDYSSNAQVIFTQNSPPTIMGNAPNSFNIFPLFPQSPSRVIGFDTNSEEINDGYKCKLYQAGSSSIGTIHTNWTYSGTHNEDIGINKLSILVNGERYYMVQNGLGTGTAAQEIIAKVFAEGEGNNATSWVYLNNHWCKANSNMLQATSCVVTTDRDIHSNEIKLVNTNRIPNEIRGDDRQHRWGNNSLLL